MLARITIFASALGFAITPALAIGDNTTDFMAQIEHEDLDLTTKQGVAVLDARVKTIIRKNCANGGRDSASIRAERECRAGAFAKAERQVRFAIAEANAGRARYAANNYKPAHDATTPGA